MRGADYAGFLKPTKTILESENRGKLRFEPITNPVRHSYSCNLVLESIFLEIATVAMPKCSKTGTDPKNVGPQNYIGQELQKIRYPKIPALKNYKKHDPEKTSLKNS